MSLVSQRTAGTPVLEVEMMYYVLRGLTRTGRKLALQNINLICLLVRICPQRQRKVCPSAWLCLHSFACPTWAVLVAGVESCHC